MLKSEHVSDEDLLEMINGNDESAKLRNIGQHLHQCEDCRKKLDTLTAQSVIWEKTPVLLKSNRLTESDFMSPNLLGPTDKTQGFPRRKGPVKPSETSGDPDGEDGDWQFSFEQLLDSPRHPEMIGRIGKYDIEREIGRGGMGVVLKAHDAELNRPLAIKILAPHLASNGTARKRFAQEAIAAAGVIHPNVIAVHGVNNEGKTPYIVMPYISGWSLQSLVDQQGPLTEIEIVRIALQISSGLAAAHSQGLVHRDIKPANILVEEDVNRVLITDFGLARAENDASLTRTGWLTGTPNYMSPEQTKGERPDQRSDLFSFGSLIYFLATGRLPFRSETPFGVLNRIQNDSPTPVRQVNNQISKTLSDVITRLLEKDPGDRFQSSAELHEFLEKQLAYLHQPDISKPPQLSTKTKGKLFTELKPSFGRVAGLASILILALTALVYSGGLSKIWNSTDSKTGSLPTKKQLGDRIYLKATGLADSEKLDEAIDTFEQSADFDGLEAPSNFQIGTILAIQGKEEDAERMFTEGNQLYTKGKMEDALVLFQKTAAFPKHAASAHYNAGCILAIQGNTDEAFEALGQAIESGFGDSKHFRNDQDLVSLREDQRFDDLVAQIEVQENVWELMDRARTEAQAKHFKTSEKLCRDALELDPDSNDAALNLGYAIHLQGRIDEAFPWFVRAANSKGPSKEVALGNYNLCCHFSLKNKNQKALDYFDKAIEADLPEFLDIDDIDNDSDLDNIRDEGRFAAAKKHFGSLTGTRSVMYFSQGRSSFSISKGADDSFSMNRYQRGNVNGKWEGSLRNGKCYLQILRTTADSNYSWGYSKDFSPNEFTPSVSSKSTEFNLEKKFGTLKFTGSFESKFGTGKFVFTGNDAYRKLLARKGIENASDALLFRLFFSWKDEKQTIANLQELQRLGLEAETLNALMIEGVEANLVQDYQESDLSVETHLPFIVSRVDAKLIAGYLEAGLDLEEHKSFINQRVEPSLIVAYIESGLDLVEQKQFISSRVSPKLLKSYREAGLDLEESSHFINQRVSASLLKSYQNAGFEPNEYRKFINWRVEPNQLNEYKSHGLSLEKNSRYIQMRIPATLVEGYSKAGFEPTTHEEFLQSRIDVKFLKSYERAGLDLQQHKDFIKRRVSPKEVLRYLNSDSPKE